MAISTAALSQSVDSRNLDDIVADALDLLATRLPEWVARNGSLEVIYLEAVAQAAAEVASAANAEVGAVVESILSNLYGVARLAGSVASGDLTLTFDSTVSTTIPAGTSFLLPDYSLELLSTEAVTVTTATSCTVPVETASATSAVNGLGSTAAVDALDTIPNALSVVIDGTLSGGADPESDESYIARAQNRLDRVTSSLVVADHFSAYVLEDGQASNATTITAWDGVDFATAGADGGEVTVACYGRGAQLSSGVRAALEAAMTPMAALGVTVHVEEAGLVTVPVTAGLVALTGYTTTDVQAAVEAALTTYLAPETWTFGDTVRLTSVTALLAGVEGVDYVSTVTLPAADTTLDANQLASPGTLTISVS